MCELENQTYTLNTLLFSMVGALVAVNSFKHRIHEQYVMRDAVAQLILCFRLHSFALCDDQLFLEHMFR